MLARIKSLLWGDDASSSKNPDPEVIFADEMTRYPPFAKGFPVAPVSVLLNGQKDLVSQIRSTLRFNAEEFDHLVLPVIEQYAAFVHLLPASEAHHHRGSGGLFRHGLEVGRYAAQMAEAYQFCVGDTPQEKRKKEPRWQLAAFFGGLLHDLGKPFYDVNVVDSSGTKIWNPQEESLLVWAESNEIDRYFIRWRDKRKTRHKAFSPFGLGNVLTVQSRTYLNEADPDIMAALIEAVQGMISTHELTEIVIKADSASVKQDMKSSKDLPEESAYGVPVETYIFNAIRRMVSTKKVNEEGAVIWNTDKGVFVCWKQVMPDVNSILDQDRVAGVPRNPETLVDILTERGYIMPYHRTPEARPERYWKIYPEILGGIPQECVKIDDPGRIFSTEPPVPVKVTFEPVPKAETPAVESPEIQAQPSAESNSQPREDIPVSSDELPPQLDLNEVPVPDEYYSMEPSQHPMAEEQNKKATGSTAINERVRDQLAKNDQPKASKANARNSAKPPSPEKRAVEPPPSPVYAEEEVEAPKRGESEAWDLIEKAIQQVRAGKKAIERLHGGEYGIPFPSGAKFLGTPKEVMTTLSCGGLLREDTITNNKTTTISGKKYLVVEPVAYPYIKHHLSAGLVNTEQTEKTKLPTPAEVADELIKQAGQGFGKYIHGDVAVSEEGGSTIYTLSDKCIKLIIEETGLDKSTMPLVFSKNQNLRHEPKNKQVIIRA